jgi:hypothetical protein
MCVLNYIKSNDLWHEKMKEFKEIFLLYFNQDLQKSRRIRDRHNFNSS